MYMRQHGYKAFNKGLTNRYGMEFKEGETYTCSGSLRFGNDGNGFHFCERLEDTLRYFPAKEEEIDIAKVTALGDLVESEDNYYGYYDMFCTDKIRIDKVLKREEILGMFLNTYDARVIRFLQGFSLTPEEIELFRFRYQDRGDILDAISYYQEGKLDTYMKKHNLKR